MTVQQTSNRIRTFGRFPNLILVLLAVFLIPLLSGFLADALYPAVAHLDPNETFLWITIHHLFQLILTVVLMLGLGGRDIRKWGFNFSNFKASLGWIGIFAVVWFFIQYGRISNLDSYAFSYPLTSQNMLGVQGFQYLLSGLGEEPLFRGFVITFLLSTFNRVYKLGDLEFPVVILISVVLFMAAHIGFDFSNLANTTISFDQQMASLQLGLVYGYCYYYTRSLFAPIVMHGLSNGMQFTLLFLLHG